MVVAGVAAFVVVGSGVVHILSSVMGEMYDEF